LAFRRYCSQNVKDGIQIQVYNISNESVNHSIQFISEKVKKKLRKSQAQFRDMLRKLRLRQNNDFLIKKNVYIKAICSGHWAVKHLWFFLILFWRLPHAFLTMNDFIWNPHVRGFKELIQLKEIFLTFQ